MVTSVKFFLDKSSYKLKIILMHQFNELIILVIFNLKLF